MKPSQVFSLNSPSFRLAIAVGGIYGSFVYFGILQEKLFRTNYAGDGQKFKFSWIVIFLQALLSWVTARCINRVYYKIEKSSVPWRLQAEIATYYSVSMFGSNQALKYVPYVVQALMKSSKVLSVMLVSAFAGTETFSKIQYFSAMLITGGIIIFNLLENSKKLSSDSTNPITFVGLFLLILSLFSDGMTSSKQSEARNKYKPSIFEMMESSNVYAILIAFLYGFGSMELMPTITYVLSNPECFSDLIILAVMGTFGQCFVYFTIINFNSFYLSVITTTRKFFTVISSILIYGHDVSGLQWLSIILVFVGVGLELFESKNEKHKAHGSHQHKTETHKQETHAKNGVSKTHTENHEKHPQTSKKNQKKPKTNRKNK